MRQSWWALGLAWALIGGVGAQAESPFGLNLPLASSDPQEMARELDGASALGVQWVRVALPWASLEPAPGARLFAPFDRLVGAAQAHHLALVGVLGGSVAWASPSDPNHYEKAWAASNYPPASLDDWAHYVEAVVRRYHERIHVWEIWNAPDDFQAFEQPQGQTRVAAYLSLLQRAYGVIKQIDPQALVLSGSFALDGDVDPNFVPQLLAAGGAAYFDAWSFQAHWESQAVAAAVAKLKGWSQAYGVQKPLWLTAVGAGLRDGEDWIGPYDRQAQADFVPKAVATALALGVSRVFWDAGYATAAQGAQDAGNAGSALMRPDGVTPAAYAFGWLAQLLADCQGPAPLLWGVQQGAAQAIALATPRGRVLIAWAQTASHLDNRPAQAEIAITWDGRSQALRLSEHPVIWLEPAPGGQGNQDASP